MADIWSKGILIPILLFLSNLWISLANQSSQKPSEILDLEKKYKVAWEIDDIERKIIFEAEVETNGFVGLGISPTGGMDGADIFIGGVKNGKPYSGDYHGVGQRSPVLDDKNNWELLTASENGTHTHLRFSRLLDTCDDQDRRITEDSSRLIWAFGDTDDIGYHNSRRGVRTVNFLMPEPDLSHLSNSKIWEMATTRVMRSDDTSYDCSFHRTPLLNQKHHVIGFDSLLKSDDTKRHVHHWTVYKCYVPKGKTGAETFEPFVGLEGTDCFLPGDKQPYPVQHCTEMIFTWSIGGKVTLLPENIGYPIGEDPKQPISYYMFEAHINNPDRLHNVSFTSGTKVYYTDKLRPIDGGTFALGTNPTPQLTIPPNSKNYVTAAHCSTDCSKFLPAEGVTIFNVLLHSHLAARKMRVRHFRDGVELPWITSDDHYDFNFQQNLPLRKVINYRPGDHLTIECEYDITTRNGKAVVGGAGTMYEMCNAFIWYYPLLTVNRLDTCGSSYSWDKALRQFGITNYTILEEREPVVLGPKELVGLDYQTIINTKFNWTSDFIEKYRFERRYGEQESACRVNGFSHVGKSKYIEIKSEYSPPDQCQKHEYLKGTSNTGSTVGTFLINFLLIIQIFMFYLN